MIPQAMLQQYAIDESLRAAEERQKAAALAAELEKVDWQQKTGAFARLDQDLQKGLQVTDKADVDAMKAFGAAGSPTVTTQSVDPQVGSVTQSAEDRLAKMLRFRDLAEANAVEVPLDATTARRIRSPEQVARDENMMAFEQALIRDQEAAIAQDDAQKIADANAAVNTMLQAGGSPATGPDISGAAPMPAPATAQTPTFGYTAPAAGPTMSVEESQLADFVRAQVVADPGLRAAIQNDEMVARFWHNATNQERMQMIEELKRKVAEARMFGESPSRVTR
jgi:hypothetical protein